MSIDLEQEAKEAVHRADDAVRPRERVSWRIAGVLLVVCSLFAFILGYLHK